MLLCFLMTLFQACAKNCAVKSEVVKIAIDESLLQTPIYKHEQAQDEKDVVLAYIKLYSFYLDLHSKISTIKKFNECFKMNDDECLKNLQKNGQNEVKSE